MLSIEFNIKMDKTFWDDFYSMKISGDSELSNHCSSFAKYVEPFIETNMTIFDMGCGNGRDTIYFKNQGLNVIGVDTSKCALDKLSNNNIKVIHKKMSELEPLENIHKPVVYSRFSIHSVPEQEQDKFFKWIASNCYMAFIETRSVNDPRCGVGTKVENEKNAWNDTHYRRFTMLSDLTRINVQNGAQIIKAEEEWYDANYKQDKAVVNRLVLKFTK